MIRSTPSSNTTVSPSLSSNSDWYDVFYYVFICCVLICVTFLCYRNYRARFCSNFSFRRTFDRIRTQIQDTCRTRSGSVNSEVGHGPSISASDLYEEVLNRRIQNLVPRPELDNMNFIPDNGLPPYSVDRNTNDSVIFRVELNEPSESRRGSSSVSEKLPTYAEIVEEKRLKQEALQSASQQLTRLHVQNQFLPSDVTTSDVTTSDTVGEDLDQPSSDEEGVPPPAYTEH